MTMQENFGGKSVLVCWDPTMLIHIPFYGASDDTMGILSIIIIVIQMVFLIGSIFRTEKALKNNFNEDGTKR